MSLSPEAFEHLLLDRGTYLHREDVRPYLSPQVTGAVLSYFVVRVRRYPDGGYEAVVQRRGGRDDSTMGKSLSRPKQATGPHSEMRSRRELTSYCRWNELDEMWTLTFREVPDLAAIGRTLEFFFRRFRRAAGDPGAYAIVDEYGTMHGRLHFHVGARWAAMHDMVEVCERCAVPALRSKRQDLPVAGSLCLGCIWGLGFVGRPASHSGDPGSVSAYLAKYLAKDVAVKDSGGLTGQHRYRIAPRHKPEPPTEFEVESVAQAMRTLEHFTDGARFDWWSSDEAGLDMPTTLVGTSQLRPAGL